MAKRNTPQKAENRRPALDEAFWREGRIGDGRVEGVLWEQGNDGVTRVAARMSSALALGMIENGAGIFASGARAGYAASAGAMPSMYEEGAIAAMFEKFTTCIATATQTGEAGFRAGKPGNEFEVRVFISDAAGPKRPQVGERGGEAS